MKKGNFESDINDNIKDLDTKGISEGVTWHYIGVESADVIINPRVVLVMPIDVIVRALGKAGADIGFKNGDVYFSRYVP